MTKKELCEIIDSNGELIGQNAIPTNGSDLESQANNTTDHNMKIGRQPFTYNMLARFGFNLMPFYEGKENQGQLELLNDLAHLAHDKYIEFLKFYYKNPNKLKSDFRILSNKDFETQPESKKKIDIGWAKKIIKLVEKHFENAFSDEKNIDEGKVVEDKVIEKKSENEMSKKGEDKDLKEKNVEKIAGLINKKLNKKDINKLINLLEIKELKDESKFSEKQKQTIKNFVREYKGNFKDEDIHKFSDKIGLDKHEVEEFIYNIARKELRNGK